MATKDAENVIALESFMGKVDGQERVIRQGDLLKGSDPAVKKWPHFFGPPTFNQGLIEQATAAPGEKRGA